MLPSFGLEPSTAKQLVRFRWQFSYVLPVAFPRLSCAKSKLAWHDGSVWVRALSVARANEALKLTKHRDGTVTRCFAA